MSKKYFDMGKNLHKPDEAYFIGVDLGKGKSWIVEATATYESEVYKYGIRIRGIGAPREVNNVQK